MSRWIVIKSIQGDTRICVSKDRFEYFQEMLINRGGHLWKDVKGVSETKGLGLLRLIYLPEPDNQTAAITICLKHTDLRRDLDPMSDAQLISLNPQEIMEQATLHIYSHGIHLLKHYSNPFRLLEQ